jgi:hypothetical protein
MRFRGGRGEVKAFLSDRLRRQPPRSGTSAHNRWDSRVQMGRYDFIVLKDDATIAAERSVALPNLKADWPRIG